MYSSSGRTYTLDTQETQNQIRFWVLWAEVPAMSDTGFVASTIDFASILSPEALAALQELAVDRGVIKSRRRVDSDSDDDDDNGATSVEQLMGGLKNHFQKEKLGDKEQIFQLQFGEISFEVKGVKQALGQTLDSTGLTIWRAAEHLCEFLVQDPSVLKDRHVCELGGGLGVVSIFVHKLSTAKSVICTDGDEISMDLLRINAEETGCSEQGMLTEKLYWGEHQQFLAKYPLIDLVLAADVVYEEEQIEPLLMTSLAILQQAADRQKAEKEKEIPNSETLRHQPEMILAYARRNVPIDRVFACADRLGLKHELLEGDQEPIVRFTLAERGEGDVSSVFKVGN